MHHVDWYMVTGAVAVPEGPCIELLVLVTLPPQLHALKLLLQLLHLLLPKLHHTFQLVDAPLLLCCLL
jgi:hypothetical protein